jgi:ferrous iron transport protein B
MKHCHDSSVNVPIPQGARKIVLAGNPNAGKSVFFNFLTGVYVDVSNYPGTTLEISSGHFGGDIVIDTPGVYGLSSFNDEERVARDVILAADIVVNIVDAVHLERDLFLTQQLIDTGVPVLVALNMMDEAENQHLKIDVDRLAGLLGVPVIPTVAVRKKDLQKVAVSIDRACPGWVDPRLRMLLAELQPQVPNQGEALLILEGDPVIAGRNRLTPRDHRETIYLQRRERIDAIIAQTLQTGSERRTFSQTLGNLMLDPLYGWLILALALWVTYQFIGVCVAGTVVGFTEKNVMAGIYEPMVRAIITRVVAPHSPLGQILIGEFGLFTMTVTYLFGLLLPLVAGFYLMLSLLEDSGYLPRIATLVDRAMNAVGLNGKAVIPLILGFGCVTVATITTRLLGSDRERRIAIFLLGLAIPCSAQLGVIAGLLARVGFYYALLYVGVIFAVLVIVGTLLNAVIPGKTMDLMINLPPLRLPRLGNVLKKTYTKSLGFLVEAAPLFAVGTLIISLLQISGSLELLQRALAPVITGWLGLPVQTANAFIMGIIRRDFAAAGLSTMGLNPLQTVVSLVTITLFVPCVASVMVMFKERSKAEAAVMWLSTWVIAFFTGGMVNQVTSFFHHK